MKPVAQKRTSDVLELAQFTIVKRRKITDPCRSVNISPRIPAAPPTAPPAPPPEKTDSDKPPVYKRDRIYYFDHGDMIVQSEKTVFRVHREKLLKLGGIFGELLSLPPPVDQEDESYIDGVPVCPLFGTKPHDVRYLMAYAYDKLRPTIKNEKFASLHWGSAVSLLHLSHMFDLVSVRTLVIDAFKLVFPSRFSSILAFPALAGIKPDDRELFLRTYPLQAINLFRRYNLTSLLPMAYYRAAQLDIADIVAGVVCADGTRVTIPSSDVITIMEGRELLRRSRRTVSLRYLNDYLDDNEPEPPSPDCLNTSSRFTGDTCAQFLVKVVSDFNSSGYMDSKTDVLNMLPTNAHDIFELNLCGDCFDKVSTEISGGLVRNWKKLPSYFGWKDWKEITEAQKSEDKRYED
ncbi:hypothetical protein DXG03_002203 [Asterophora parasitica]|uniref:BTB domain-containing protein n=1 Tax=Asterophora parasitica TaxID=117018 RepID=A0A9P7KCG1_9AGAR|nr:hypothetical protein DXG03_002203 [Asterophora parasitica]